MTDIRKLAEEIVAREGGYVNDPDDPGGATNYGVTIGTLRALGLDVNGDGVIDEADVRALTRSQAVEIFVRHYFERPRLGLLPQVLQPSVFDMYVHAGANAVRILQRLLNEMGFSLAVDGIVGPKTASAAREAAAINPEALVNGYGIARRNYYYSLAERRPALRKFVRRRDGGKGGWIGRAEEFIAPHYHLSDSEHRERTARWV